MTQPADPVADLNRAVTDLAGKIGQLGETVATRDASLLTGADVKTIIGGADGLISASGGTLLGINLTETASQAATVSLCDGTDDNAAAILTVDLEADGERTLWLAPCGIGYTRGLFVTVDGGTVAGHLYTVTRQRPR